MDRQREYDLRLELEGARMNLAVAEAEIRLLRAESEALRHSHWLAGNFAPVAGEASLAALRSHGPKPRVLPLHQAGTAQARCC